MKVDMSCLSCGCGPEEHFGSAPGCQCGECYEYVSPLSDLELAIALAAVDREAEELREFRRLIEYAERRFPNTAAWDLSKLRESLRERMNKEGG